MCNGQGVRLLRRHGRDAGPRNPQGLYPPSKNGSRVQRITVDACRECNNGFSDDEVHFRNILVLAGEPTPIVREHWEGAISRSLAERDGRRRALDLGAQLVPVRTAEGERHLIYPGRDERCMRVICKIVGECAIITGSQVQFLTRKCGLQSKSLIFPPISCPILL